MPALPAATQRQSRQEKMDQLKLELESESEIGDHYQLEEVVHRGVCRTTYLAHSIKTGELFYCKRLDASEMPESTFSSLLSSIHSAAALQEKGYLTFESIHIIRKHKIAYIITPDCGPFSLAQRIADARETRSFFDESLIWMVLAQTVAKLYALHFPGKHGIRPGKRFVHCQLKPSNIFLDEDLSLFLIDPMGIGFASHCWTRSESEKLEYVPNEAMTANTLTSTIDIYALGCILYELCTLTTYSFNTMRTTGNTVLQESQYSVQLKALITSMLNPYADSRPSARNLMGDPNIQQYLKLQQAYMKLRLPSQKKHSHSNIAHDLKSMAAENEATPQSRGSMRESPPRQRPSTLRAHPDEEKSGLSMRSSVAFSPTHVTVMEGPTPSSSSPISVVTIDQGINTDVSAEHVSLRPEAPRAATPVVTRAQKSEQKNEEAPPINLSQITISQIKPEDLTSLKNYCRFLENEVAALRSDLVIAESLKHKYNDELTSTRIKLMKCIDVEAQKVSPSGRRSPQLGLREDASSMERRIKDLEIQLSMERANTFILRRENAKLVEYLRNIDVTMTTCAEQQVPPMEMVDQVRSASTAARELKNVQE